MAQATSLYGGAQHRRVTILDLASAKERGEKWPMLTAYEQLTAEIFDEAGIPVLLVGDSAGNNFLGFQNPGNYCPHYRRLIKPGCQPHQRSRRLTARKR